LTGVGGGVKVVKEVLFRTGREGRRLGCAKENLNYERWMKCNLSKCLICSVEGENLREMKQNGKRMEGGHVVSNVSRFL